MHVKLVISDLVHPGAATRVTHCAGYVHVHIGDLLLVLRRERAVELGMALLADDSSMPRAGGEEDA